MRANPGDKLMLNRVLRRRWRCKPNALSGIPSISEKSVSKQSLSGPAHLHGLRGVWTAYTTPSRNPLSRSLSVARSCRHGRTRWTLGQLRIYAGMLAFTRDKHETLELRLIYVQADSLTEAVFSYTLTAAHARADLALMLLCYAVRMQQHDQRNAARVQWSAQLRFPLPQYRPSQKAIARRVFKAIKQREKFVVGGTYRER